MMNPSNPYPALPDQPREGQPHDQTAGFQAVPVGVPAYQQQPAGYQPQNQQQVYHQPLLGNDGGYAPIDSGTTGAEEKGELVQNYQLVLIICAASALLMVQGSANCDRVQWCKREYGYAVAVGTISLFLTGIFVLAKRCGHVSDAGIAPLSTLLFVWWTPGVLVLTWKGPFTVLGNGYFGSWVGFIASAVLASRCHEQVRGFYQRFVNTGHRHLLTVLVSSGVILFGMIVVPHQINQGWTWACSIVSLVVSGFLVLFSQKHEEAAKHLTRFLAVWWTVGAIILTFSGPYLNAGNGYFASWAAFAASALMALNTVPSSNVPVVAHPVETV